MPEPTDTLRRESIELTTRILELDEILARGKREFFAGGKGHSHIERSTLEAERAELKLRRHKVNCALEADKARAKAQSQGAFIAVLCAELEARGMGAVIEVARQKLAKQEVDG